MDLETARKIVELEHRLDAIQVPETLGNYNIITIPDNVAQALQVVDTGGLEHMRVVSTDANPSVIFYPDGGGNVGIGAAPGIARHLYVYDNAVSATTTYYGIDSYHEKTAGVTDIDDNFYGLRTDAVFNQAGGVLGYMYAGYFLAVLEAGTLGDVVPTNRELVGAISWGQMDGGTLYGSVYGGFYGARLNTGSVLGVGHVYGLRCFVDINAGMTAIAGNVYGCHVRVDDDFGVAGTVYMLFLAEATGVDYGIYQSGTADNALGGHLYPINVKTQDLGLPTNEWDDIYYVTVHVGTSRLVRATRMCPVCGTEMSRGTGTTIYRGEEADYAVCFCLNCGNAAVEELNHLPPEKEIEKRPPPIMILENIRVKSAGRNRSVAVDFRYGEDVLDKEGDITERAIRNSTRLGEYEFDEFFAMNDKDRLNFLRSLAEREWYSREETRLMQEEAGSLRTEAKSKVSAWLGKDLLREAALPN